jgi:Prp8 binding protein
MSREKRPANEAFGTSQLVKRTKSDANLGSSAVAVVNGSGANGALIQAVP